MEIQLHFNTVGTILNYRVKKVSFRCAEIKKKDFRAKKKRACFKNKL